MNPQLYKRLATINGKSFFDNSIAQSSENVNAENVKNGKLTIVKQLDIKAIRHKKERSGKKCADRHLFKSYKWNVLCGRSRSGKQIQ